MPSIAIDLSVTERFMYTHRAMHSQENTVNTVKKTLINRPGVSGAVLQTPLSPIKSVSDPFPPDLQNIIHPQLLNE